jgi:hypothetical protein
MQTDKLLAKLFTKISIKISTKLAGRYLTIHTHHIVLLTLLLTPVTTVAETTQIIRVIETGTPIEQHSANRAADYNQCHFDEAHGHLHCYADLFSRQSDQVITQKPNTITRTTRSYTEPATIIERHYYTNIMPQPNVILGYNNGHRYRSNPHYRQRTEVYLRYNNFRYNDNRRYDRRHKRQRPNRWNRNRNNH